MITLRSTKGSPLTNDEIDANFTSFQASDGSSLVGTIAAGAGAVARTVETVLRERAITPQDKGAIGDGVTDDTTSFVNVTAAGNPVYVPKTANFYSLTSLSVTAKELLWGPGIVKVNGVVTPIQSVPTIPNNNASAVSVIKATLAPAATTSDGLGAVGEGGFNSVVTRTGGFGQYGNALSQYLVTAAIPTGQFDVGITSWITATNLTGAGQIFGGWRGANTPSAYLGQTYTGGGVVGDEVNVGNRWGEFGLQTDVGGTRYTVGQQIIPDVVPALDGVNSTAVTISVASPAVVTLNAHGFIANMGVVFGGAGTLPTGLTAGTTYYVSATGLAANTFQVSATVGGASINTTGSFVAPITVIPSWAGSFAHVFGASVKGHRWWVTTLIRSDTLVAGGHAYLLNGGSVAGNAPLDFINTGGFWTNGIDLTSATFSSTQAIKLAAAHAIAIGSATIAGGGTGSLAFSTAGTNTGVLYSNNFGLAPFQWGNTGGASTVGFYGTAPVIQSIAYGTPTNVVKTSSLAGTAATLAQVGGTLAALIADLKTSGLIGA